MKLHHSQGACIALEDTATLGVLFNKKYFEGDVKDSLDVYEKVRLPRVMEAQSLATKAAYSINERVGFSSDTSFPNYKVPDEEKKLTIEEMNGYDIYKDMSKPVPSEGASRMWTRTSEVHHSGFKCPMGLKSIQSQNYKEYRGG